MRWPSKRRNMVGAVCTCGKFINAKNHQELLERVNSHHRNCPTFIEETYAAGDVIPSGLIIP